MWLVQFTLDRCLTNTRIMEDPDEHQMIIKLFSVFQVLLIFVVSMHLEGWWIYTRNIWISVMWSHQNYKPKCSAYIRLCVSVSGWVCVFSGVLPVWCFSDLSLQQTSRTTDDRMMIITRVRATNRRTSVDPVGGETCLLLWVSWGALVLVLSNRSLCLPAERIWSMQTVEIITIMELQFNIRCDVLMERWADHHFDVWVLQKDWAEGFLHHSLWFGESLDVEFSWFRPEVSEGSESVKLSELELKLVPVDAVEADGSTAGRQKI